MGFITGFTGGVTLTLGIAYLTILSHQRNREAQALNLRSQSQLLNSLAEPAPLHPPSQTKIDRQRQSSFVENAKEHWNTEIENAVRLLQTTDWNRAREGMEGAVARMLGLGLQKSQEGIEGAEKKAGSIIVETLDKSIETASKALEQRTTHLAQISEARREGVKENASISREGLKQLSEKAKEMASATRIGASRAAIEVKEGAVTATESQSSNWNAGTVDTARGVVRDAIGRGIEKGKQVIGKAQESIGSVVSKSEPESIDATSELSPVEKALRGRYENQYKQGKTVEQVLEERYKPIDQRDNMALKSV